MIEKNRDILSKAIQDMAQRSPAASGWDGVADRLDQLEAAAFAGKAGSQLPVHKAPADAWDKIAAKLPPAAPPFWAGITGKIIAGLLIVGTASLVYLFIPGREENSTFNTLPDAEEVTTSTAISNEAPSVQEDQIQEPEALKEADPVIPEPVSTAVSAKTISKPYIFVPEHTVVREESNETYLTIESITYLDPVAINWLSFSFKDAGILLPREAIPGKQAEPEYFDESRFKLRYKAGAFYAFRYYQQMEQEGMQVPRKLSSGGLEFVIEKNRWSLKTGLEYLGWTEKGSYSVNYNQNQLIYRYNYVDSAFINTFSGEVSYFTSEREVFDSIPGQITDQASYQYRMLQIPLLLGYKVLDRGRFSIGLVGGVGFDIRLSGKQFIPVFDREDASVTEVRNSLQYRTNSNWRVIAGLEAGYRFAKNWEFYLEPSYQQYMKPAYAPGNTKGIGSFKLKAGVHFLF